MGKKPKPSTPPRDGRTRKRLPITAVTAVGAGLVAWLRASAPEAPPAAAGMRVTPAFSRPDGEGDMEIYRYPESFREAWAAHDANESLRGDVCVCSGLSKQRGHLGLQSCHLSGGLPGFGGAMSLHLV